MLKQYALIQVGSMLKTPRFPIWVTKLNGTFGLLFSTNPDLVSDWRVEHRFQLHYFTGLKTQVQAAVLSIGQTLFVSLTEVHCLSKILIDIFLSCRHEIWAKNSGENSSKQTR